MSLTKLSLREMPAPASKMEEWLSPMKSEDTTCTTQTILNIYSVVEPGTAEAMQHSKLATDRGRVNQIFSVIDRFFFLMVTGKSEGPLTIGSAAIPHAIQVDQEEL